jgi:DNA-binding protein H-NS
MDLKDLSLEDLKQLQKDIDAAIKGYEARKLAEARSKLEAMASEMGVKLEDIVDGGGKGKSKSTSIPKYRHPENPALTWTGRGRRPQWFIDAIENGASKDDLKI